MAKRKAFIDNKSTIIMYTNEENMVVMPNHENNGDYYENPSLPYLMDEL